LTASDPIRLPAFSKNNALHVQHTATPIADTSPVCTKNIFRNAKLHDNFHILKERFTRLRDDTMPFGEAKLKGMKTRDYAFKILAKNRH
jgi:hypothetical protein